MAPAVAAKPELVVLVTRPQPQAGQWVQRLRERGLEALALPLLHIAPADAAPLRRAAAELAAYRLVMFVSPSAVQAWFDAVGTRAWPAGTRAGATGPGSAQALRDAGVPQACIVQPDTASAQFDSAALWQQLAPSDWHGARVLIVRGDGGRDELAQRLRDAGAAVEPVQAYARATPRWSPAERAVFDAAKAQPLRHCWLLSSSESIGQLRVLAPDEDTAAWQALATHPRIAEAAQRLGFGRVEVCAPTLDAVVAAIERRLQSLQP